MPPTTSPSLLGMVARMKASSLPEGEVPHTGAPCIATRTSPARRWRSARWSRAPRLHQGRRRAVARQRLPGHRRQRARQRPPVGRDAAASPCPARRSRASTRSSDLHVDRHAADHRFRTKSSEIPAVVFALAKALGVGGADLGDALATPRSARRVRQERQELARDRRQGPAGRARSLPRDRRPAPAAGRARHGARHQPGPRQCRHHGDLHRDGRRRAVSASRTRVGSRSSPRDLGRRLHHAGLPRHQPGLRRAGRPRSSPTCCAPRSQATTIHVGLHEDETAAACATGTSRWRTSSRAGATPALTTAPSRCSSRWSHRCTAASAPWSSSRWLNLDSTRGWPRSRPKRS
jgi:hypothetical protein